MHRFIGIFLVALAATFSTTALAHEPKLARPLDFDRELQQVDETAYMITVASGDSLDFSAEGIARVTIDEARHVSASTTEDKKRLVLKPCEIGKAVVRIFSKSGDVTTVIIKVTE